MEGCDLQTSPNRRCLVMIFNCRKGTEDVLLDCAYFVAWHIVKTLIENCAKVRIWVLYELMKEMLRRSSSTLYIGRCFFTQNGFVVCWVVTVSC